MTTDMSPTTNPVHAARRRSVQRDECSLADFRAIVEQPPTTYPRADRVAQGVPIYECARLRTEIARDGSAVPVRDELTGVLLDGPGILMLAGAFDPAVVDRASAAFQAMIDQQHAEGRAVGDHYAKPGANDRVWNAIEKLAVAAPGVFVDYYANDMVALAAHAWLGPNYQISSQVNVVNPGGAAQQPHRDFHLGFTTDDQAEEYPAHIHAMSPMLTLQGAVAHCDMPVETGPTMYLPHSQKYPLGFLAWRRPEFVEYFREHHTQLPLGKGDAVFFSPALFHAAGSNHTNDVKRMANLLQISSAMARAMETMDRIRMSKAVYPALLAGTTAGHDEAALRHAAVAAADGYAFPTNLDNDPPLGGLTPPSHLDILLEALAEGLPPADFDARVDALAGRRRSS